jgi:hypothetical protein
MPIRTSARLSASSKRAFGPTIPVQRANEKGGGASALPPTWETHTDHEPALGATEVNDEAGDRKLAAELRSGELAIAKLQPQSPLCVGHFPAKPSCPIARTKQAHRTALYA